MRLSRLTRPSSSPAPGGAADANAASFRVSAISARVLRSSAKSSPLTRCVCSTSPPRNLDSSMESWRSSSCCVTPGTPRRPPQRARRRSGRPGTREPPPRVVPWRDLGTWTPPPRPGVPRHGFFGRGLGLGFAAGRLNSPSPPREPAAAAPRAASRARRRQELPEVAVRHGRGPGAAGLRARVRRGGEGIGIRRGGVGRPVVAGHGRPRFKSRVALAPQLKPRGDEVWQSRGERVDSANAL